MILSNYKEISKFLSKKQRIGLLSLIAMIFVGMVLEIFGLGVLVPTISLMQNPELLESYSFFNFFNSGNDYKSIIQLLVGAIFFLNIARALYMLLLTFLQNKFISKVTANISNNLFAHYLNQNYSFFLNTNTSKLIKNIQVEVGGFNSFLGAYISLITEGLMMLAVLATVIIVQPLGALLFFIFIGSISYLILKFSKGKLNAWSKNREEYDNNLSKAVLESLGGIKDFKIYNAENFFIKKYSELNLQKAGLISKYLTLSQTPRFLLEITLVVGILIFIIFMFFNNTDSIDIVSSLGLFVAASFRLIPSVNKLIFSLQSIGYNKISINLLKKEFKINSKQNQSAESNIKFNNKIVIKDLSYRYPSQKRLQLEKLNFEILKGQKVGIIGESGSGKSTFVDLFTALLEPTDGDILVDGQSIYHSEKSWKSKMGYVPQSIYLMDDTIANNITLFEKSRQIDYELLEKVIKNVGLYDYINSLPKGVSTTVGEKGVNLSGGQLQRIGLARAFYRQPQVLILDESTSALDPVTEKVILESIYKMSNTLTVIFISHKKSNLDKCDVIYKIEENLLSIV